MNLLDLWQTFIITARGVAEAILPLLFILLVFQTFFLRLPPRYLLNLLKGALLSATGLLLFLLGVQEGFLPFGYAIGEAFDTMDHRWLVIPLGFILGFVTTRSEPAVRILCNQVEKTSAGSIRASLILFSACFGVGVFVALGMARIIYSIPILYILIPGYLIVLLLLRFTQPAFISIAFDAGGVATGPVANTFLLGLGLGLASAAGSGEAAVYGLGLVALIALAPIISVMVLGIIIRNKSATGGN
ncbi:Protein of unknown function (DUF1538) [Dehalogenimonas alkenigignens]|uniref:DUF1538 domain-containing protein n=1 Tax=Dehalogenimonas alkenigignens TaxID=1217799 RepID=A0A0W0GK63_9CHLR|nr:DUF1538 domain-containing protein [Dehalogenimonas alkenigignens]KTB48957.1 Protein of unknown function (DUF1538) [Dehalogenimonas alkenigignens]